jgi:hypothetical protein
MAQEKTEKELREFGQVMGLVLNLLTGLLLYKGSSNWHYVFAVASLFVVLSIFYPRALRRVEALWMLFGEKMSFVMTKVVLAITYFLLITPLAIIVRLFGVDLLKIKAKNREKKSYWIIKEKDDREDRYFTPF